MFKRLVLEDIHTTLAVLAFMLTAAVFAVGVWRAVRIKPEEKKHLSMLPLDDGKSD